MEGRQERVEPLDRAYDLSSLAAKWRQSHGVIAQCNSADQTQQRRGRYLLAPSLTWSPGCTPAASWAACPAATRSGIIGPSPEGSMIPASSQV